MAVSLKKVLTTIALAFVLLAGMFGWTMRIEATMPQPHTSISGSHQMVLVHKAVCPPPPFSCLG